MSGDASDRLVEAVVVELLPAAAFRLQLGGRKQVIAHLAPATERNFVRLRLRDRVLVELTAGDPGRGRITRLLS
jgi:translation initiation factor IF-1